MNELSEGAKVLGCWTGGKNPKRWLADDQDSMVISMQHTAGGVMTPWVKVTAKGPALEKVVVLNCALLEGVTLAPKED